MTRLTYTIVTTAAVSLIGVASIASFAPRLIWNASASTPIGLYSLDRSPRLEVTDLVAVDAPEPLASFLAERDYVPRGVPLMKRVAALPGQRVCRTGARITIDGIAMGEALERDRLGRELPVWQGCRRIGDDEVFLMNFDVPDSVDGRYFGPLSRGFVIGRALPVWTDEAGDGRFQWRATTR